jgi:hypothetical protein
MVMQKQKFTKQNRVQRFGRAVSALWLTHFSSFCPFFQTSFTLFQIYQRMCTTKDYIKFLESRRFEEIMNYSSSSMENDHNFIQWIFPTTTRSMFTDNAPIIDIKELRSYDVTKISRSFEKITEHWGIKDNKIVNLTKFKLLNGHNGLRFSRVLQSLVYHDKSDVAKGLLDLVLKNVAGNLRPRCEGSKTIWEIRYLEALAEVEVAMGTEERSVENLTSGAGVEASQGKCSSSDK